MCSWHFMLSCVKDSAQDGRLTWEAQHDIQETVNVIIFCCFQQTMYWTFTRAKKINQNNILMLKTNLRICDVPVGTRRRDACQQVKMTFFERFIESTNPPIYIIIFALPPLGVFGTFPRKPQTVVKLITSYMISNNDPDSLTYFSISTSIITQTWFISISGERLLYQ